MKEYCTAMGKTIELTGFRKKSVNFSFLCSALY